MKRRRSVLLDTALDAVRASNTLDGSRRSEAADELRQRHTLQRGSAQRRGSRRERLDGGLRWTPDPTGLLWFLRLVLHGVVINERASEPGAEANGVIAVSASGRCCACGYDVRAVPRLVPPEALGGVDLGPFRCPECGGSWPLIPSRPE